MLQQLEEEAFILEDCKKATTRAQNALMPPPMLVVADGLLSTPAPSRKISSALMMHHELPWRVMSAHGASCAFTWQRGFRTGFGGIVFSPIRTECERQEDVLQKLEPSSSQKRSKTPRRAEEVPRQTRSRTPRKVGSSPKHHKKSPLPAKDKKRSKESRSSDENHWTFENGH